MTQLKIQPIPYQGSKRALAPVITRFIPSNVEVMYEPFAGSAALTLYAAQNRLAKRFVLGDILAPLVVLWQMIIDSPNVAADSYAALWNEQFAYGDDHFYKVRSDYNSSKNPIMLFYLMSRCVKNAIRFSRTGNFTQSVDKRRNGTRPETVKRNFEYASFLLKGKTEFFVGDFEDCISNAGPKDIVYMDPPYQGTSCGLDKRYFAQMPRERIVRALYCLNARSVPYILSYDGSTGDKIYSTPLPAELCGKRFEISVGRSSQATLSGRKEHTVESLYISDCLNAHCPERLTIHSLKRMERQIRMSF